MIDAPQHNPIAAAFRQIRLLLLCLNDFGVLEPATVYLFLQRLALGFSQLGQIDFAVLAHGLRCRKANFSFARTDVGNYLSGFPSHHLA